MPAPMETNLILRKISLFFRLCIQGPRDLPHLIQHGRIKERSFNIVQLNHYSIPSRSLLAQKIVSSLEKFTRCCLARQAFLEHLNIPQHLFTIIRVILFIKENLGKFCLRPSYFVKNFFYFHLKFFGIHVPECPRTGISLHIFPLVRSGSS